jgi:NADH:ubiquinone oxidoreductase subunit F (NADH-binding)
MDIQRLEGLRGCGGAGFPVHIKWQAVADEPTPAGGKIVVCNADEGEPGTLKDGWLLKEHPRRVVLGMQRAAAMVGAARGFVYLRPEYTEQLRFLQVAIHDLIEDGFLSVGSGALWNGAGFPGREVQRPDHPLPPQHIGEVAPAPSTNLPFRLDIVLGGGAYICGEETALLESMEGRRPQPRHKPPYPTQSGLWGLPTLMNNVETFWWAERILSGEVSTPGSHRLYSLSGDVENPGVYEAPVGITARDLIDAFGGGVIGREQISCWIPGGAASGVLPPSLLDTELSPEALREVGTSLGTAGVVVHAKPTDPVRVAAEIMEFFAEESCSQCTPCRLGNRAFATWTSGAEEWPEESVVERWLEAMELGSICGLGFTAPLVVRQLQRWFGEVEAQS